MVCLTQSRKRGRETESPEELLAQKEREARLAAQRARHAPKQETETAAAAAAELRHLSALTRDKRYATAVERQLTALLQLETLDGVFPDLISL